MSEFSDPAPPHKHDPLATLRQPNFVFFVVSRVSFVIGSSMLQTLMLWQVYEISDSTLSLGLMGLARLIPTLALCLVGGAVADSYNRRNIVMISQCLPLAFAVLLAAATMGDWITLELLYAFAAALGVTSAFEGPARNALLPGIVKPENFAAAVNLTSTVQTLSHISGPLIGGFLISYAGVGSGYVVFSALAIAAILTLSLVRYRESDLTRSTVSLAAIYEGVRFVREHQVLLGAMALDLFAVIFGGVKALLPVYAVDILKAGPSGFGILQASFEIGAFLMSFVLLARPPVANTGRALIWTVAAFGIGTIVFGLSRDFYLSLGVYLLIGAADQVSVVMRTTTIQMATPDELRGRVSAVDQVFSSSSNQLNAVESGVVAALTTATFAVVTGGFGTLASAALIVWRLPGLYHYRVEAFSRESKEEPRAPTAVADNPEPG